MGRIEVLGVYSCFPSICVTVTNMSNKTCHVSAAIIDSERGNIIARSLSAYSIDPHKTRDIECPCISWLRCLEGGRSYIVRLAVAPEGEEGFTVEHKFRWGGSY